MVGTNLKAETMALMEKRAAIEADMNSIIHRLSQPGGPGLTGYVLDADGFPRAGIDLPGVREQRRLAALRNDHREITDKINVNIQILHSVRPSPTKDSGNGGGSNNQELPTPVSSVPVPTQNAVLSENTGAMDVDMIASIPFAMVDEITESSPAAEDGLQLGDQIVKFGSVEAGDSLLQRLAAEAQSNQGQAVSVVVRRQGALVYLSVTPRIWEGRGLLGCHFRML